MRPSMLTVRRSLAISSLLVMLVIVSVWLARMPTGSGPDASSAPDLANGASATKVQPADSAPSKASAAPLAKGMPDSAFKVAWTLRNFPATLKAGRALKLTVGVTNTGDQVWPDRKMADPDNVTGGGYAVRMSYRFRESGGKLLHDYQVRVELPEPVPPGKSVSLPIEVQAPQAPGDYVLQFDLVQELYRWFADKGASQAVLPVKVVR